MTLDTRIRPASTTRESLGRVQGIIFDVDGTLYDQSALRWQIARSIAAAHWITPLRGVRVIRALRAYRQAHEELRNQPFSADLQLARTSDKSGYTIDEVRITIDRWFERKPLTVLRGCVYPGIPEFLELLAELRIRCGVFSDYAAEAKLSAMGLKHFFRHVLCAAEVGKQKPDPVGILAVARQMSLTPERTLYVGDRNIDLQAAASAGMQGILVKSGKSYSILHAHFASRRRQQLS